MLPIILASTSPRRKEIMDKLCLPYEAVPPDYEEDMTLPLDPFNLAKKLAFGKASSLQNRYTRHLIIGSDTFGTQEGKLLGKPKSKQHAFDMLQQLSGKAVSVITWLAIINTANNSIFMETDSALVYFNTISTAEIERYLTTNEWVDKAWALAIQWCAWVFIDRIEGDFNTIMGLPLRLLYEYIYLSK